MCVVHYNTNTIGVMSSACDDSPILILSNNAIVVFFAYAVMRLVMKQTDQTAKTRAVFMFLCVSMYVLLFGYGPPTKLNPSLFGGN